MARGPQWAPGERVKVGPPFPRSVGGAPGLCRRRRRRQMHDPRCPPATGGGAAPSPSRRAGDPLGAPPLRPRVRRGKVAAAAAAAPPPPSRFPPRLTRGGGEPALGAPAAARGPAAETWAGGGPETGRGRSPAALHPTQLAGPPRGRIAFKTFPSPPPLAGQGAGAGRGGAGAAVMCPRSRSAPTFSLRSPNSAPTFSLLVPTLPGAPKPARLPPPSPGLWKQPQILSEGSPCGREDKSRGPNPPSHRQTPLGKVLPLSRKRNPGGCGQGQGRWGGGVAADRGHTATVYPSLGGHGPGYSGFLPKTNPQFFHRAFYNPRKSLLLSHPTLSCCY